MQQLIRAILEYPAEENFPLGVAQYNKYRDSLSVLEGVPVYGRRVILPHGLKGGPAMPSLWRSRHLKNQRKSPASRLLGRNHHS